MKEGRCFICGEVGHTSRDCKKRNKGKAAVRKTEPKDDEEEKGEEAEPSMGEIMQLIRTMNTSIQKLEQKDF